LPLETLAVFPAILVIRATTRHTDTAYALSSVAFGIFGTSDLRAFTVDAYRAGALGIRRALTAADGEICIERPRVAHLVIGGTGSVIDAGIELKAVAAIIRPALAAQRGETVHLHFALQPWRAVFVRDRLSAVDTQAFALLPVRRDVIDHAVVARGSRAIRAACAGLRVGVVCAVVAFFSLVMHAVAARLCDTLVVAPVAHGTVPVVALLIVSGVRQAVRSFGLNNSVAAQFFFARGTATVARVRVTVVAFFAGLYGVDDLGRQREPRGRLIQRRHDAIAGGI
jgi:hypothetical protein